MTRPHEPATRRRALAALGAAGGLLAAWPWLGAQAAAEAATTIPPPSFGASAEGGTQAQTVVFAVGAKPEDGLDAQLVSMGIGVIKAGDCVKPRRILDSVAEGFAAGNRV